MSVKFNQGAVSDYGQDDVLSTNGPHQEKSYGILGEAFGNIGSQQAANSPQRVDEEAIWHSNIVIPKSSPFYAKITGPVKFMGIIQKRWGLSDADAAKLFGLASAVEYKLVASGQRTLPASPDIRERFGLVARIHSRLSSYLRNETAERSWMTQFSITGSSTPIDLIRDGRFVGLYRIGTAVSDCFGE